MPSPARAVARDSRVPAVVAAALLGLALAPLLGCRTIGDREQFNLFPLFEAERVNPPASAYDRAGPLLRGTDDAGLDSVRDLDRYRQRYDPVTGQLESGAPASDLISGQWPLDRYRTVAKQEPKISVSALAGLFEYEAKPLSGYTYVAFHPLFSYENDPARDRQEFNFLYPLGVIKSDGEDRTIRLLPLFNYSSVTRNDGAVDEDFFLFPLIWYGREQFPPEYGAVRSIAERGVPRQIEAEFASDFRVLAGDTLSVIAPSGRRVSAFVVDQIVPGGGDTKRVLGHLKGAKSDVMVGRGYRVSRRARMKAYDPKAPPELAGADLRYFAFFPFGGTLRDFLLKDWIEFFLFPLFYHAKTGEYESWYLPWPIIHWGRGGGRRSAAVFPLFSTDVRYEQVETPEGEVVDGPLRSERYTFLWPLLHFSRIWDTRNVAAPGEPPRYERQLVQEQFALFPLYGYSRTPDEETINVLWPFFRVTKRADEDYISVDAPWPIFRYAEGIGESELRIWPLYWRRRTVDSQGEVRSLRLLWPLFWYDEEWDPTRRRTRLKILPLLFHERTEYLDPIDGGPVGTTSWTKLWPLLGVNKDRDGAVRVEVLSPLPLSDVPEWDQAWAWFWRLFYYERSGDGRTVKWSALGPLLRYSRDPTSVKFDFTPVFQYRYAEHQGPDPWNEESVDFVYGLLGWGHDREGGYFRLLWFIKIR